MNHAILAEKRILVVEDNSINQMLVKHTLLKSGASVEIANNGTHALTFIEKNTYDIILMDLFMPELDGYQTTKIIREELHLNIPIVAMTALAIKGEEEKCFALGMNGYVSKPFTFESLCNEITRVLNLTVEIAVNESQTQVGNNELAIDLGFLHELAGGDADYAKSMIKLFLENIPTTLQSIQKAVEEKNWLTVGRLAHYIKSSLSVVKVKKMFDLSTKLERNAQNEQNYVLALSLIDQLNTLYLKAEFLLQKNVLNESTVKQVA